MSRFNGSPGGEVFLWGVVIVRQTLVAVEDYAEVECFVEVEVEVEVFCEDQYSMRAVIQRVTRARVVVDQATTGDIGAGLLVLLGVEKGDTEDDLKYVFSKTIGLRVFEDDQGKMNRALNEVGGQLLVVSQFTLLGDVRKGRRPSFVHAAEPELAKKMYDQFILLGRANGIEIQSGIFQADMAVELVNDGPVTIMIDSRKAF